MPAIYPDLLEPEMQATVMKSGKQWSKIVAWSWSDVLAYEGDTNNYPKEVELKKFFCHTIQQQASNIAAAVIYGDETSILRAQELTKTIKALFKGEKGAGNDLTLSKVLCKLAQPDSNPDGYDPALGFIPTINPEFFQNFSYEASVVPLPDPIRECGVSPDPILDRIHEQGTKYVITLHYPPVPRLGPATFTEEQLEDWMRGRGAAGDSYLPPSAYMVMSPS
jgi:hypothetical protein